MMLPESNKQVEVKIASYIQKRGMKIDWGTQIRGIWHVSQISSFTAIHFDEGGKQISKGVPWIQSKFILRFWWVRSFWGDYYHQKVKQFANIGNRNMSL